MSNHSTAQHVTNTFQPANEIIKKTKNKKQKNPNKNVGHFKDKRKVPTSEFSFKNILTKINAFGRKHAYDSSCNRIPQDAQYLITSPILL